MIHRYRKQHNRRDAQRQLPRQRYIAGTLLKAACDKHQYALSEHHRDAVEGRANTDKPCLAAGVMCQHIVTVGCDIVRCGRESRDDKQHQRQPEHRDRSRLVGYHRRVRMWQRNRQQHAQRRHQYLHRYDPPAFGLHHIHQRTP